MADMIGTNWPAVVLVVAILLVLAWLIWSRRRLPRARYVAPDALDEGAGAARRNQALIDAPSSAARLAGTGPDILGGMGEVLAAAATSEVAAAAEPAPIATLADEADDLTRIKGVGPKLSARLRELGVNHFAEVAAWTPEELAAVDAQLGSFAGRPERDGWVEQCRYLAVGDVAGFEAKFGKV